MTPDALEEFIRAYGRHSVTVARSVSPARIEAAKRAQEQIVTDALNALRLLRVELDRRPGGKA